MNREKNGGERIEEEGKKGEGMMLREWINEGRGRNAGARQRAGRKEEWRRRKR